MTIRSVDARPAFRVVWMGPHAGASPVASPDSFGWRGRSFARVAPVLAPGDRILIRSVGQFLAGGLAQARQATALNFLVLCARVSGFGACVTG